MLSHPFLPVLCLLATFASAETYFPPPDTAGGWRTALTAAEAKAKAGISLNRLEPAWQVCERGSAHGGLLIVRNGWLVFERYFGRGQRDANPDMASTGKAYTSIACGVMLEEFKAKIPDGLDTKVYHPDFLPEGLPTDDPRKLETKLGHLLCMTAGTWGEGVAPRGVVKGAVKENLKPRKGQDIRDVDGSSLKVGLWCAPGEGYSYSSPSPHLASMVLRRVTGMELKDYIDTRLAKPMGWGPWHFCLHRGDVLMAHANGAGSTAVHATDALRLGWCLCQNGKWKEQQLVPASYLEKCRTPSPYNPHTPFSLQFEHNADGHVPGAPRDAFYKSGANGFALIVVPSLQLVIYKLGGRTEQWNPELTGLPQPPIKDHSRDDWQPIPKSPFDEGSLGGDDGVRRVLEFVTAATLEG
jgi:CubicO group peptidase (beta-lactamase class C family)